MDCLFLFRCIFSRSLSGTVCASSDQLVDIDYFTFHFVFPGCRGKREREREGNDVTIGPCFRAIFAGGAEFNLSLQTTSDPSLLRPLPPIACLHVLSLFGPSHSKLDY